MALDRLLSVEEILTLPPPEWLIEGLIPVGSFGVLYGPSGSGKSFLLLDWALSVAVGSPWNGRKVKQGPVVYVVAEGGRGIVKRVKAWMQHRDVANIDVARFALEAVQVVDNTQRKNLLDKVRNNNLQPSLFVFDTFARCFLGGDENSAKEVGQFVECCQRIQDDTGSAVLLGHHTPKSSGTERGSGALRGAANVMFSLSNKNAHLVLKNDKQKDDEEAEDMRFVLGQVGLAEEGSRPSLTSCVLVPAECNPSEPDAPNAGEAHTLHALAEVGDFAVSGAWRNAVSRSLGHEIPAKTFDNRRRSLISKGLVESIGRNTYRLTEEGHAFLTPFGADGVSESQAANSHPPIRGGIGVRPAVPSGRHAADQSEAVNLQDDQPGEAVS